MDDMDLGVALSVTSLVMALAQDNLEQYKGAYVKAAARLKRILVDGECSPDYLYYKVPCPWIQVKLLRILQNFPPSDMAPCPPPLVMLVNLTRSRGHSRTRHDPRMAPEDVEPGNGDE